MYILPTPNQTNQSTKQQLTVVSESDLCERAIVKELSVLEQALGYTPSATTSSIKKSESP